MLAESFQNHFFWLGVMKNIAVLVYELTIEYNATVLNGIVDFFAQKNDVRLFISPIKSQRASRLSISI